jgi:hypothetical protein
MTRDSKIENIELSYLIGPHTIDGRADFVMPLVDAYGYNEDAHVFVMRLDGQLYWFQEDPSDGYRSGLAHSRRCDPAELPAGSFAEFPAMDIEIEAGDADNDTLIGRTPFGAVLFEVGTCNAGDYYPSFVATWNPENACVSATS